MNIAPTLTALGRPAATLFRVRERERVPSPLWGEGQGEGRAQNLFNRQFREEK